MPKSTNYTKADVIDVVYKKLGNKTPKTQISETLSALFDGISELLKGNGDEIKKIVFTGYLTLTSKLQAAKEGRDPGTGKKLHIPATRRASAKIGARLKGVVSGKVKKAAAKPAAKKAAPKKK